MLSEPGVDFEGGALYVLDGAKQWSSKCVAFKRRGDLAVFRSNGCVQGLGAVSDPTGACRGWGLFQIQRVRAGAGGFWVLGLRSIESRYRREG
jgi:hypothetical protein